MPPQEQPKQGRHSPNGRRPRTRSVRDSQRVNELGHEEECPNEEFEQDPTQVENPSHSRRRPRDFRRTGSFFAQHEDPNNNTTADEHAAERNDRPTEQETRGDQLPTSDQFPYRNPFTPNPPPNQRDHYYQNQSFQGQPNMAPIYGNFPYTYRQPFYPAPSGPAYGGFQNNGNNYYDPNAHYAMKNQWGGQQWGQQSVPPQNDQYGYEIPRSNTTKPRREPSTKKKATEARRKSGSSTDSSTSSKTLTEMRREIKKDVMRSVENRLLRRDVEALSRKGTSSLSDASHENPSHEVILRLLNLLEAEKSSDSQSMESRRASMPPDAFVDGLGYGPRHVQTRSTRASWDGSTQPSPPRRSPEFPEGQAQLSFNEILQLLRSYRLDGPSENREERQRFTRPPRGQFEEWLSSHDHQHPPTRPWGDSTDEERGVPGVRRSSSTRPYASGGARDPRSRAPHPHHPNECPCCQHAARYGDVI